MKLNNSIKFSLVLCLVGLTGSQALAFNNIGKSWSDNYPDACPELQAATQQPGCVLCHFSGTEKNDYALDLKNAGYDFAAVEDMDSDGDGRTNGEEILIDCTLPGDPASPVDLGTWGSIKVLFR